ncbi:MAG: NifU family protein [Chlamydiia bacterium]|nr:NifU family protein [Chlamydiia bacterium]
MTYRSHFQPFYWGQMSRKIRRVVGEPKNAGSFDREQSEQRGVRLVVGREGSLSEENRVEIYALVDTDDGVIVDAKFQVFGHAALIAAAEAACHLIVSKTYEQANRVHSDLLDRQLRDKPDSVAFPSELSYHLSLVISAIHNAAKQCYDIPLKTTGGAPPPSPFRDRQTDGQDSWSSLAHAEKLDHIERILDEEIRPYIALDSGGVEVVELTEEDELIISYQGNCTSCYSSVGTTLAYIQQVLIAELSPTIKVTPEFETAPTEPPPWMRGE